MDLLGFVISSYNYICLPLTLAFEQLTVPPSKLKREEVFFFLVSFALRYKVINFQPLPLEDIFKSQTHFHIASFKS